MATKANYDESSIKILEGLEQAFIMRYNTYNDNSKFNYTKGGEDIGNRFGKNNPFYGKNRPVTGGYFAGYYNGKPNIVGAKLFIEV